MNLSQRRKTRFTYCLDMDTLREHLETFGNILPAAMMRDAFYRSGYAVKMGEKGLMSDDDIETRMRARRGAFENETVTIVHDKLFDMNCPWEQDWEEHPKNRVAYKVTLKEQESVWVLSSDAEFVEGINDVVAKDLGAVELEVMPLLTGRYEDVEADMAED